MVLILVILVLVLPALGTKIHICGPTTTTTTTTITTAAATTTMLLPAVGTKSVHGRG